MKIVTLSDSVVSKISAGEVIERPVFAVKELIENAIDANATVIEIHIEEAGLKRIRVQDNGDGMSKDDLELSYLPHTTSKLLNEHELVGIKTLGFRGEALASIAAISTLSIKTRLHNQPGGYEIIIRDGNIESVSPIGTPPGTIIIIDNLFLNVPARKKFLKSERTEFRLISDMIIHFALSYPHIHFVFINNKKPVLDLPKKNTITDRIAILLGPNTFEQLVPIKSEDGFIKISGFIGKPQIASKQNQKQFLFVNNRHITDRMISLSVKESFGTLLPASSTPLFILHLTIPPEVVDVNVHPRKEQVLFINSRQIFDAVKQAVTDTLTEHNLTFKLARFKDENSARLGETTSYAGSLLKQTVLPWDRTENIDFKTTSKYQQIHQTYIFSQTKDTIFFIDQHAAHERILYEEFAKTFTDKKKTKDNYELPKPNSIIFGISEAQILEEYLRYFDSLGFKIDHFQGTNFMVRAIPVIFKGRNIEKIMRDILSDLAEDLTKSIDDRTKRMLAFLACRAAVKAGDV
ncbi:DNA mismatch repair endonuclease MutL [soil metagenome]